MLVCLLLVGLWELLDTLSGFVESNFNRASIFILNLNSEMSVNEIKIIVSIIMFFLFTHFSNFKFFINRIPFFIFNLKMTMRAEETVATANPPILHSLV